MIIVRIKTLVLVLVMVLASTAFLFYREIILLPGGGISLNMEKQELLYWALIVCLFQTALFIFAFRGHRKLIRDLKKLISNRDLSHPQSVKILNAMGETGRVIRMMMEEYSSLLDMRLNRISAFNKIIRIICEDYPEPLMISDTLGTVLGISDQLLEKTGLAQGDLQVGDVLPEIKMPEVLGHMEKNRSVWKDESGCSCTPVFDRSDQLNLCIWELEAESILKKITNRQAAGITRKTVNTFRDLIRRKK